jgi:hypothetical protein
MEQTKQRFPFIDLFPTWLINVDEPGPIFQFEPGFVSCAIENSVLINVRGSLARCKNILSLFITKNAITKPELTSLFEEVTKGIEVKGIHTAYGSDNMRLIVAGHLQAMFLTPGLRETTIGEFVNQHPDVIKRAFKTENFIYEPFLDWLEHDGTVIDKAINPDLLIQRDDGFYDIYDLKTAMLGRSRITKGEQRRRRFIDAVAEGVHQLSHYRMYFQFSANRELAEKKYGIRVSDPRLVLVVGSWENVDPREVIEATRAYSGIDIIDYDTLVHFFLGTAEKANPSIPTV